MRSYFLVELLPLRADWIGSSWVGAWEINTNQSTKRAIEGREDKAKGRKTLQRIEGKMHQKLLVRRKKGDENIDRIYMASLTQVCVFFFMDIHRKEEGECL